MSHPLESARLRRGQVVSALVAIVVAVGVAGALGALSQKSKIDDLTTKNNALAAAKAEAIQQRDAARQERDDRAVKEAANEKEAQRIEAQRPPGATLFAANCASCHGRDGGGGIGPQLSGGVVARNLSETDAVAFVSNGGGGPMPKFDAILSPAQIKQVVAYVRNL